MEDKKKMGRPSQGRSVRMQINVTPELSDRLEEMAHQKRTSASDLGFSLLGSAVQERREFTEVIDSLRSAMVTWHGSWLEDHRFAWIYGIIVGWENEEEICKKFHWDEETRNRFRQYRQMIERLEPVNDQHP